jgi:hypothetical protein
MVARRPFSPWTIALGFVLCAVAVPLGHQLLAPPEPLPRTLTELTQRLHRAGLDLHVVQITDITPEEGLYLCERPQEREQLQWLRRAAEYGERWQGVVFCEFSRRLGEIPDAEVERWGEYGMRIGPFLFFGDPVLLRRIAQVLLEAETPP